MHGPLSVKFACQGHSLIQDVTSWKINRFNTGISPYFSVAIFRINVLFKQEKTSNSFQAVYRFLQYFASMVFPVVFYTLLSYICTVFLFILPFYFVLFAWFLIGKEVKKVKYAKRYVGLLYTVVSPVTELYSVRFSL